MPSIADVVGVPNMGPWAIRLSAPNDLQSAHPCWHRLRIRNRPSRRRPLGIRNLQPPRQCWHRLRMRSGVAVRRCPLGAPHTLHCEGGFLRLHRPLNASAKSQIGQSGVRESAIHASNWECAGRHGREDTAHTFPSCIKGEGYSVQVLAHFRVR